ncbi:MAG TPA: prepilin-type N-terminal cleavage/methylation domain-containing protein [Chthoniobacterales bacterium]|nr:prepilin-type N-terminal cleavage/methylation domain-containing protein [Chthoniobacterales bacterium]
MINKNRDSFTFGLRGRARGFTLIELLVVIAIIATIAAFAVPALTSALTKGQMTGTMNSARQMYLAGYQMALDGSTNSDANLAWPGDYASGVATLADYCGKLVANDYLKVGDLPKLLSAPGASCTVTGADPNATPAPTSLTLTGKSALKVYKVKDTDASNTLFAASANYTYNKDLAAANAPYGDKGFIVVHKGGDAIVLRKNNATAAAGYGDDEAKFQAAVGVLPGGATTEGSGTALTNP